MQGPTILLLRVTSSKQFCGYLIHILEINVESLSGFLVLDQILWTQVNDERDFSLRFCIIGLPSLESVADQRLDIYPIAALQ